MCLTDQLTEVSFLFLQSTDILKSTLALRLIHTKNGNYKIYYNNNFWENVNLLEHSTMLLMPHLNPLLPLVPWQLVLV